MSVGQPHIIRLRGPWEFTLLTGPRAGETGPLHLQGVWQNQLPADTGGLRLTRYFQAPTGIGATTPIQLIVRDFPANVVVALDGDPLTAASDRSYDLTARLQRRHRLDLDLPGIPAGGEVWLEIREQG